ncbi:MAG: hypothetical protein V3T88_09140 [Nitrosomonadaceae bacterium]
MTDKSIKNIPIRFFILGYDPKEGEADEWEVSELDFIDARGTIIYSRHTLFDNGANEIILTKDQLGQV